jgi:hypothetical protein
MSRVLVRLSFQSEYTESGNIRQEAALDSFKLPLPSELFTGNFVGNFELNVRWPNDLSGKPY